MPLTYAPVRARIEGTSTHAISVRHYRAQGGLGVGLTLAQRLALAHGGRIIATSPGTSQGSTFTVHLPRVDGPCWNSVPLFHLHRGEVPTDEDWATTSGILEKLERYR